MWEGLIGGGPEPMPDEILFLDIVVVFANGTTAHEKDELTVNPDG